MLIDTHAHVNFNAFKDDSEEVIKRSLKEGVFMINVGSQYATSQRAVEMAEKNEAGVWAAVGLHPIHITLTPALSLNRERGIERGEEFDYVKYLKLAENPKVVAIGEVGLDYKHFEKGENVLKLKIKQKEVFLQAIKLANEVEKPLIIHCWGNYEEVSAYNDILEILENNPVNKGGVIHCFIGGYKTAKKFIELGYKIGLNGIMTYAEDYNRLISELSLSDIVLETDCPYLTPKPLAKNERNEPVNVKYVAEKIAKTKNVTVSEVGDITSNNAKMVFGI